MKSTGCQLWKLMLSLLLASVIYVVLVTLKLYWDGDHQNGLFDDYLKDDGKGLQIQLGLRLSFSDEQRINLPGNPEMNSSLPDGPEAVVIILFLSNAENIQRRSLIHKTYVQQNEATVFIKTVFIVGNSSSHSDDDIDVVSGTLPDTHPSSETDKIICGIDFVASHFPDVNYVFVVRDNMYVNYELLVTRIVNGKRFADEGKTWIGNVENDVPPNRRDFRDRVVDEFALGRFPKLCVLDTGFGLSGGAVKHLYEWTRSSDHYKYHSLPRGDVFIGYAAKDDSWTIIADEELIPPSYDSLNVCAFRSQTITAGFDTNQMWEMALGDINKFKHRFARFCQDPDLSQILLPNISNAGYFNKTLNIVFNPRCACLDSHGKTLTNLTMIMLVNSHPNHFSRRKGIRNTWAKQTNVGNDEIQVLFVLGKTMKAGINREVEMEARHYNDIILSDVIESFKNLTLKLVLGLKWVTQNCDHVNYFYKGDDDMFVNIENLLNVLKNRQHGGRVDRLYMGTLNKGEVIRNPFSKYYVSEQQYSGKFFSPFCSGGSYVISTVLIPSMYAKSYTTQLLPVDDAYQGLLGKQVGVTPLHHQGFKNYGGGYDTCSLQNDVLTVHGFTNEFEFHVIWTKLKEPCKYKPFR